MPFKKWVVMSSVLMTGFLHAVEVPKARVMPSAYRIWWSENGLCLIKKGIEHYEVFDAQGQSIWSRTMQANNVILSPDGTQLAYVLLGDGLYVYTFAKQDEQKIVNIQGSQNTIVQLSWSPTGEKLAYWIFANGGESETPGELVFINSKQ